MEALQVVAIEGAGSGEIIDAIVPLAARSHEAVGDAAGHHAHVHAQVYFDEGVQPGCAVGGEVGHHVDPEVTGIDRGNAFGEEAGKGLAHGRDDVGADGRTELLVQAVIGGEPVLLVGSVVVGKERRVSGKGHAGTVAVKLHGPVTLFLVKGFTHQYPLLLQHAVAPLCQRGIVAVEVPVEAASAARPGRLEHLAVALLGKGPHFVGGMQFDRQRGHGVVDVRGEVSARLGSQTAVGQAAQVVALFGRGEQPLVHAGLMQAVSQGEVPPPHLDVVDGQLADLLERDGRDRDPQRLETAAEIVGHGLGRAYRRLLPLAGIPQRQQGQLARNTLGGRGRRVVDAAEGQGQVVLGVEDIEVHSGRYFRATKVVNVCTRCKREAGRLLVTRGWRVRPTNCF